jgi:hypothetical protein
VESFKISFFNPVVSEDIVTLFGHDFLITEFIASSIFVDKSVTFLFIFLASCDFVNDIPVLLIASQISIHFLISFHASVIVVGISLALGSFLTCSNAFHHAFIHAQIAIYSATSLGVGSLHSVAT